MFCFHPERFLLLCYTGRVTIYRIKPVCDTETDFRSKINFLAISSVKLVSGGIISSHAVLIWLWSSNNNHRLKVKTLKYIKWYAAFQRRLFFSSSEILLLFFFFQLILSPILISNVVRKHGYDGKYSVISSRCSYFLDFLNCYLKSVLGGQGQQGLFCCLNTRRSTEIDIAIH